MNIRKELLLKKSSANLYLLKFLEIKNSFKIIFRYLIKTLPAGFEPAACLEEQLLYPAELRKHLIIISDGYYTTRTIIFFKIFFEKESS